MSFLPLALVVATSAALGAVGVWLVLSRRPGAHAAGRRGRPYEGSHSEEALRRAVDTLVELAGSQLDARLRAGSQQLDHRGAAIEQQMAGVVGELHRMADLVSGLQRERAHEHGQIVAGLEEAMRQSRALASTTQSLQQALASPKARGQWGERMADDVLRAAGFVEGLNYRRQTGLSGGGIPDVTFLLPGERELHMDVKFPIDNYLRHLDAVTDGERDATRARFLRDVRDRVRELARRRYGDPSTALDHVLLFIPNESVWGFVLEHDPALIDLAMAERVVLCSPTTLVGVLAVLRQSLDDHLVERTSGEILECLEAFERQWDRFGDALDGVGRKLETTTRAFEELSGPRRRQLQRTLDRVDALRDHRLLDAGGTDEGAPYGDRDPDGAGDDDPAAGIPRLVDRRFG